MRTSTTTELRRTTDASGFTIVEVMAAALLGALVLVGILTTNLQLMRSGVRITHYAEMNAQVRRGLEQFESDVRGASAIQWNGASDITLTVQLLSGSTRQVTYAWTSATQAFFLVPGTDSTVTTGRVYLQRGIPALADGSAGVLFARYDRDGNVATTDSSTKSLRVSLNLVRTAQTVTTSTETAVSPLFILRNKPVS